MKRGSSNVIDIKIGSTPIKKVYRGSSMEWQRSITVDYLVVAGGGGNGSNPFHSGGGGAGGSYNSISVAGGSGIVIVRYPGTSALATGGNITFNGGYVYHTFTSSSTFTI